MEGASLIRWLGLGLLICAGCLVLVGWVAINRSEEITGGSGQLVRQQMVWSVLGLAGMTIACAVDYRWTLRLGPVAYLGVLVLLAAVYGFPAVNGARRWIRLGAIGIQPSEFSKLIFIVALAGYLKHRDIVRGFSAGALGPLAIAAAPMFLILKEPDLGTSLVFLPVLLAMVWAAGCRGRDLVRMVAVGLLLVPLLWSQMSHEQRSRVTALAEQNAPREKATADGFHLDQAKRMFAQGSMWGSIFSSDADDSIASRSIRVPEPHTDSVYCVIGERFGMFGAAIVLVLFSVLVGLCLHVAARCEEPAGRLIAVGVAALVASEVLINTGMLVGLLPITGLALPLVSYGGSDLMAHLLAVGVVVSIARRQVI